MVVLFRNKSEQEAPPQQTLNSEETKKGAKEVVQERQKRILVDQAKADGLAKQSNRVLLQISTVFPFTFFPTIIVITENKIDFINKFFFGSSQVFTLLIADLKLIEVTTSWFFATLRFEVQWMEQTNPEAVSYLKRSEGIKAKNIISGLIALRREQIDLANFSAQEVVSKAEEIGSIGSGGGQSASY